MSEKKIYCLADCNSFYASCERVFNPKLMNRPVAVLSNNDGCIVALSAEVKALGIKMGTPIHEIQDLVKKHQIAIFSSNYALYGELSHRVMTILESFCDEIEIYSIDEAFLDMSKMAKHFDLIEYAKEIRQTILQYLSLPVSFGIAHTKVLAKLSNRMVKKNPQFEGVFWLNETNRVEILKQTEVGDIWGIGSQLTKRLNSIGIKTAFEFANMADSTLRKEFSIVEIRLAKELRGESCLPMEEHIAKKQIICSRSFGRTILEKQPIKEAIANHVSSAAEKLRKQGSFCGVISVFIRTNPFSKTAKQYSAGANMRLAVPTADTTYLIQAAHKAFDSIFKQGFEYKKAGIVLNEITPSREGTQTALFAHNPNTEKSKKLFKTIDQLNLENRRGMVKIASCGVGKKAWEMNSQMRSPNFLSKINEIPVAKLDSFNYYQNV